MQIKGKYSWLKHVDFMLVDLTALFLAFVFSYRLKFGNWLFYRNEDWNRYIVIIAALNVMITLFVNPYSGILRRAYYMEIIRTLQLTVYNFAIASMVFFSLKIGAVYSRELSFYMYGFYFCLSLMLKFIWKELLISGRVVIKTTKPISLFIIDRKENIEKTLTNVLAGDFQLYSIEGVHLVDDDATREVHIGDKGVIQVIGDGFEQYVLSHNIKEVLVAVTPGLVHSAVYEKLNSNGVGLNMVVEAAIGFQPEDQFIQNFGVYKAVSVSAFSFTPAQVIYLGIKRLIDILCGLVGLVILIPLTLVVKAVNLLSGDTAPVFYRQKRVGQDGKTIYIWKYRSMMPDADEVLKELLKDERYRREWEENQKFENDPRVTKAGKILRKTSIDELPQLLNVLAGDMSLVGPRPLVEGELEAHNGLKLYQKVKPGITGWWGCNGRSNIDYRERLELEYYYVKNCSLYLDLLCICRTVLAVLKKDGAK